MAIRLIRILCVVIASLIAMPAAAQALYKYRGDNGEWIFADRPPDDGVIEEIRDLGTGERQTGVSITTQTAGRRVEFVASNGLHTPVEIRVRFQRLQGVSFPNADADLRWIVAANSTMTLMSLDVLADGTPPSVEYGYEYFIGDPRAEHRPDDLYRVPFAIANKHRITQAYPDVATHTTADSYHAVDIAMPIGTDVVAARGGVVFAVMSDNFSGGINPERDGPLANVVQILHDDGTYAVYAHLNWNSIRVQPGDRVSRGEYIADSGNTGFSSGPHLHFAVLRNVGMVIHSVPVQFEGANSVPVVPATGNALAAY